VKKLVALLIAVGSCGEMNFSPALCYEGVDCPADGGPDDAGSDALDARIDGGVDSGDAALDAQD
jgi:hypothetical protein